MAKDSSLAALLERMGLTRDNLMACGDGLNDRSMICLLYTSPLNMARAKRRPFKI